MRVRKTWFSYILWVLFSCSLAVIFYFSLSSYLNLLGISDLRQSGGIIAICAVVLITLFCLAEWFFNRKSNKDREERDKIYSILVIILLIILFFLFRILLFTAIDDDILLFSKFVKNALIQNGKEISFHLSSLEDMFSSLLTLSFLFLGNKGIAVWVLQLFFQTVCFVFSYFGIKRIAGRIPALAVCFGITVLPMFFNSVITDETASLKLCIASMALWMISLYKDGLEKKGMKELLTILISAFLGILCFYDNIFIAFFFLPAIICLETKMQSMLRKALNIILWFIFGLTGYGFLAFGDSIFRDGNLFVHIENYFMQRYTVNFEPSLVVSFSAMNYLFIVFAFCISYIIMFIKTEYDEAHLFIFVLLVEFGVLIIFYPKDALVYYYLLAVCFLSIAGAGIRNLVLSSEECIAKKEKEKQQALEDIDAQKEFIEYFKGTDDLTDQKKLYENSDKDTNESVREEVNDVIKSIQYIENPLPLPKKHEKKEMGYGFEPDEDKMHFDFDLTENNAFYDV